ncbi:MAG: hypothetical protein AB1798_01280, partial [Spirochaetota bacterium]
MFLIAIPYITLAFFILLSQKPGVFNISLFIMYSFWSIYVLLVLSLISAYLVPFPDLIKLFFIDRKIRSVFELSYAQTVTLYRVLSMVQTIFIGSCFVGCAVGLRSLKVKKYIALLTFSALILALQMAAKDPSFVVNVLKPWIISVTSGYTGFRKAMSLFVNVNRIIYILFCVWSLFFLVWHYATLTVKILKREWLLLILGFLPTLLVFILTLLLRPFEVIDFIDFF